MVQLTYGTKGQIQFSSEEEFFEALGFLCKNDRTTSIHWERNEEQGAWGSEGRIHCYKNIANFPNYFSNAFTVGTGSILLRINCNEYIEYISTNHGIVLGNVQNLTLIRPTIPAKYLVDFDRGLLL